MIKRDVESKLSNFRIRELLAPASLETVHRKIMGAVHSVEKDVNHYQSRQLMNVTSNPDWLEFVRSLCIRHNKEVKDLHDFEDLKLLLTREEAGPPSPKKYSRGGAKDKRKAAIEKPRSGSMTLTQEEEANRDLFETKQPKEFPEFTELKRICERGKLFEFISVSVMKQLENAFTSQLKKYCLSFEHDGRGEPLNSVREYENQIIRWSEDIQSKLNEIQTLLDKYDRFKKNVSKYITDYGQVIDFISNTCSIIFQIIEPMKKWVTSDASYARRVQAEITFKNRKKLELKDKVKVIEDQRENVSVTTKRKVFNCIKLEQELQRIRDTKKGTKRREIELGEVVMKLKDDIKRKQRELDDVKSRLISRKENSPTIFNYLSSASDSLRDEIRMLEGRVRSHYAQVVSLQKEQVDVQKTSDTVARELRENQHTHQKSFLKLEKAESELHKVRESLQKIETQIGLLKSIREIKLHTNTVKRIYHFGYQPGNMQNRDELQEAIQITAETLGPDWVQLYQKLPFQPYRNFENRSRDIEGTR